MHQFIRLHATFNIDRQFQATQIGLIAHIIDLFDLTGLDQLRHLVDNDLACGGIRDLIDLDDIILLFITPLCPKFKAAATCGVYLTGSGLIKQQFRTGREIRTRQCLQNIVVGIVHQRNGCVTNLFQVKRADIACHADSNALISRHQHIGVSGRQQSRLLPGCVVVIHHINGIGINVSEQFLAQRFQLCFCITGRRIGHIPGVDLTEVTL